MALPCTICISSVSFGQQTNFEWGQKLAGVMTWKSKYTPQDIRRDGRFRCLETGTFVLAL